MDSDSQEKPSEFPLPRLSPLIRLFKGPDRSDGSPSWTLHHPISNGYFQIGWIEFECLARMPACEDARDLIARVNKETPLDIDMEDVKNLMQFLSQNDLLEYNPGLVQEPQSEDQPLWKNILHNYLFFSIPIIKPAIFLKKTYPVIKPLLSGLFIKLSLALLAILIVLTLQRFDEFSHTFISFFSLQGIIMLFATLMGIKILHEFGHAYTAHKYGVDVPHMGIAFMVLYPVFYTETSAAWKLDRSKQRIHIGLAGIATELVLATYALLLWHILPPGNVQSLAFAVATISLVGSLIVNLNPLMRFDGYFVLSDMLGIENLHSRGFEFAHWWLRGFLFGLQDQPPEDYKPERQRFLILFGFATLIYRFFLFLGIALLVYWLFFKPLGLILMIIELLWFIGLPVLGELKIWWARREELLSKRRTYISAAILAFLLLLFVLPVHRTIAVPAIAYAENYRAFYPPENAMIMNLNVKDNQRVEEGDILAVLSSPKLEYQLEKAKQDLKTLKTEKRILLASRSVITRAINEEIDAATQKLEDLKIKKQQLTLTAPFSGVIRSLNSNIHQNLSVSRTQTLFHLVNTERLALEAYVSENFLGRLEAGQKAYFRPAHSFFSQKPATLEQISTTNVENLSWPELSSLYAGPIASEMDTDESQSEAKIKPRQSLYSIQFSLKEDGLLIDHVTPGTVYIKADPFSLGREFLKQSLAFLIREAGLN